MAALKEFQGSVWYLFLHCLQVVWGSYVVEESAADVYWHLELWKTIIGVKGLTGFKLSVLSYFMPWLIRVHRKGGDGVADHGLPLSLVRVLPLSVLTFVRQFHLALGPFPHR